MVLTLVIQGLTLMEFVDATIKEGLFMPPVEWNKDVDGDIGDKGN